MARRAVFPVFIPHLGCPNECVFCDQRRISGSPLPASGRTVSALLDEARGNGLRDAELAYYGGSFTAIPASEQEELLEAAQPFLFDGTIRSIRLSTRPDAIDAEVVERLKRYRVDTVELGAQSMSDRVLCLSGRGHTAKDTVRAVKALRSAGRHVILQMMTGLPGDDDNGAVDTARQLIALQPDAVRIYPTVVVRGTELEKLWRSGDYREHSVEDAVRVGARLLPMFQEAGIPVIRLGLNPTEELSGGAALAGAYHPALGELVRSRILRNRAEEMLKELHCEGKNVTISVPGKQLSQMLGQKRGNVAWLQEQFHMKSLRVVPSSEPDGIRIETEAPRNPAKMVPADP